LRWDWLDATALVRGAHLSQPSWEHLLAKILIKISTVISPREPNSIRSSSELGHYCSVGTVALKTYYLEQIHLRQIQFTQPAIFTIYEHYDNRTT
jgi:hypothetical protein